MVFVSPSMGAVNGSTLTGSPSSSVEDYVKAIWELAGASGGAVSTKEVAGRLCVSSASVSAMFGRLRGMRLVEYERYRGATLTDAGRAEALRLVRRHRLIETFLVEHLGYPWEEVHGEAERLEHAVSNAFTERLAELLGHPARDPHGDPIPGADGTLAAEDSRPLVESAVGDVVRITRVEEEEPAALAYLGERGLVPGRRVEVTEVRAVDGVVGVEDEDGDRHFLGRPLAGSIVVQDGALSGRSEGPSGSSA